MIQKQIDRIERMLEFLILESRLRDIQEYLEKIPSWRHVNPTGADDAEWEHIIKRAVISSARDKIWEENKKQIRVFRWLYDLGMRVMDVIDKKEPVSSDQLAKEIIEER